MSADNLLIAVIVLLILALVGLAVLLFRPRPPVTDSAALEAVDRSGREMREEIGRVRRDLGEVGMDRGRPSMWEGSMLEVLARD